MSEALFDRSKMKYFPINGRESKVEISKEVVIPATYHVAISSEVGENTRTIAQQIVKARAKRLFCDIGIWSPFNQEWIRISFRRDGEARMGYSPCHKWCWCYS